MADDQAASGAAGEHFHETTASFEHHHSGF